MIQKIILYFQIFTTLCLLSVSCTDFTRFTGIKTVEIMSTGYNNAVVVGKVEDLSDQQHPAYGFCYATHENPTVNDSVINLGSSPEVGSYSIEIQKLKPSTMYYVCAFIMENNEPIYDNAIYFNTLSAPVPMLYINEATNISYTSANVSASIYEVAGDTILERGFCIATHDNPTTSDKKVINSSGNLQFQSSITGLTPGTTYYARAFATNPAGEGYSATIIFNTVSFALPTVTTGETENVRSTSARCYGTIESHGDGVLTSVGICFGTSENPTVETADTLSCYFNQTTTSIYADLTELTPATTYYYRMYARNFGGVGYGESKSFTTTAYTEIPQIAYLTMQDVYGAYALLQAQLLTNPDETDEVGILWSQTNPYPEFPTFEYVNYTYNIQQMLSYNLYYNGFENGKTYYFRMYAKNNEGIGYTPIITYTIPEPPTPYINTEKVYHELTTSAQIIGRVLPYLSNYNGEEFGACWNTTGNPTMDDGVSGTIKQYTQPNDTYYELFMEGLQPATTYFARVWAKNENGESYGDVVSFTTLSESEVVRDYEGNEYGLVTIGSQTWMRDNLKSKFYSNGIEITGTWLYNYDENFGKLYGRLYPQSAAIYNSSLDACPSGFHLPTEQEWQTLFNNTGGINTSANHLKEQGLYHWNATYLVDNSSGFTALGAGVYYEDILESPTFSTRFWTSTLYNNIAKSVQLRSQFSSPAIVNSTSTNNALTIRCVKNSK